MLYLVGAGLGSIEDLTIKGYNAIKNSKYVYLESYTSIMSVGIKEYSEYFEKKVILADRELIEEKANEIIDQAKLDIVSLIIIGDPLSATTHVDLLQRCKKENVLYEIIHNTSILIAVADCGLQLYKYGETVSIVSWTDKYKPDKIDPPYYMTGKEACKILVEIYNNRSKNIKSEDLIKIIPLETKCILMGRIGWSDQIIYNSTIKELSEYDKYNDYCPQCLIIPSQMTEYEIEFVKTFSKNLNINK